ncbi:ferritin-like domain-containing protein [Mesorhizobium sp. IMUNJ 23232]|uniref:ferritin-like domain-containing protein n=1 Tax=Mesorhizobium sp. IMUNJ 23232 TaxID=3376064 RepID=UPI00379342FC
MATSTKSTKSASTRKSPSSSPTKKSSRASSKGLEDLFLDGLKDIYYAEKKILKALPKLAKGADSEEASAAFEKHRLETEGQVDRLEQIFESMDLPARGKTCPAIDGILEEGSEILEEYGGSPALDAGLIAAAQAVEHYEIARYGTLITWAGLLGRTDAAELLSATLEEEKATDEALTALGESGVNERAVEEQDEAA